MQQAGKRLGVLGVSPYQRRGLVWGNDLGSCGFNRGDKAWAPPTIWFDCDLLHHEPIVSPWRFSS
jgi:hypothetical protein